MEIEVTPNPDRRIGTLRIATSEIAVDWYVSLGDRHNSDFSINTDGPPYAHGYQTTLLQNLGFRLTHPFDRSSLKDHPQFIVFLRREDMLIHIPDVTQEANEIFKFLETLKADHQKILLGAKQVMDAVNQSVCDS